MILEIPELLNAQEVAYLRQTAREGKFADGALTARNLPKGYKENLQLQPTQKQANEINAIVRRALARNERVGDYVMVRDTSLPMISKYEPGMHYSRHVDNVLIGWPNPIRTDMSMTIFMHEPDTYDGGELEFDSDLGLKTYKLASGGAVIYPTTHYHRVTPVTRGERLAVVVWIQSFIADPTQRRIVGDLRHLASEFAGKPELKSEHDMLLRSALDLMRMWVQN